MAFIAFLGCDGSGKSTVINSVSNLLINKEVSVTRGHWRPHALGTQNATKPQPDDPHGQRPRGAIASVAKLGWLWLNWWLAWKCDLRIAASDGMLIFDRYHGDILVDPLRYRYAGSKLLATLMSRSMPQPDAVIFLDAAPEILLQRKQEVTGEMLEKSRGKYLELCASHARFHVVDATQAVESVVKDVMEIIEKIKV